MEATGARPKLNCCCATFPLHDIHRETLHLSRVRSQPLLCRRAHPHDSTTAGEWSLVARLVVACGGAVPGAFSARQRPERPAEPLHHTTAAIWPSPPPKSCLGAHPHTPQMCPLAPRAQTHANAAHAHFDALLLVVARAPRLVDDRARVYNRPGPLCFRQNLVKPARNNVSRNGW